MINEGYSMHLYCDHESTDGMPHPEHHAFEEGFLEVAGPSKTACLKHARRVGWTITRDDRAFCPKHTPKRSPTPQATNEDLLQSIDPVQAH